ncbi:hypothetical protein INR49_006713 [Caranx melampygus]|nr:hypothetical protein INR49_006713 [Caranx melampygus]
MSGQESTPEGNEDNAQTPSGRKPDDSGQERTMDEENWIKIQYTLQDMEGWVPQELIDRLQPVVDDYRTKTPEEVEHLEKFLDALKEYCHRQKEGSDRGNQIINLDKRIFYIIMVAAVVVAGPRKVKVYVQVTGQTSGAHKTILGQLSKNNSTQVEFTNNVEDSYLIIVFCPIGSRAGSDVAAAMGNLPVSARHKPVVLVPMHHTRDHDYSVGKTWSEDNSGVVLEVHVLFHETQPGLLPCDRNNEAVKQIQDVLYKYSKHHNSCNP